MTDSTTTTEEDGTTTTTSSPATPVILTKQLIQSLTDDLDASHVLECYSLERRATLYIPDLLNNAPSMTNTDGSTTTTTTNTDGGDGASGDDGGNNNNTTSTTTTSPPMRTIQVTKMALGIRDATRGAPNQYGKQRRRRRNVEITLELGPQRMGPSQQHEGMPLVVQHIDTPPYLTWDNEAKIWIAQTIQATTSEEQQQQRPAENMAGDEWDSAYYMASMTGAVFETLLLKSLEYVTKHRRYQPFAVYSQIPITSADLGDDDGTTNNNNNDQAAGDTNNNNHPSQSNTEKLLLKSSSSQDFVYTMWHELARVGVELSPILTPPMYEVRLYTDRIQKVAGYDASDRLVSAEAAHFASKLEKCWKAIALQDYREWEPSMAPSMSPVPSMGLTAEEEEDDDDHDDHDVVQPTNTTDNNDDDLVVTTDDQLDNDDDDKVEDEKANDDKDNNDDAITDDQVENEQSGDDDKVEDVTMTDDHDDNADDDAPTNDKVNQEGSDDDKVQGETADDDNVADIDHEENDDAPTDDQVNDHEEDDDDNAADIDHEEDNDAPTDDQVNDHEEDDDKIQVETADDDDPADIDDEEDHSTDDDDQAELEKDESNNDDDLAPTGDQDDDHDAPFDDDVNDDEAGDDDQANSEEDGNDDVTPTEDDDHNAAETTDDDDNVADDGAAEDHEVPDGTRRFSRQDDDLWRILKSKSEPGTVADDEDGTEPPTLDSEEGSSTLFDEDFNGTFVPSEAPTEGPQDSEAAQVAQQAANEAKQAAEEAHKNANDETAQKAADAAEAAANAAQKAADATSNAQAQLAADYLLSGDGNLVATALRQCFSNPQYGITQTDWNATTNTSTTTTTAYLYLDGSFYYRMNLSEPYLDIVKVHRELPAPIRGDGVGGGEGGDFVDWMLALLVISLLFVGAVAIVQQLGIRILFYRLQKWFFAPRGSHDGEVDIDDDEEGHRHKGAGAAHSFGQDVIPFSMGGQGAGKSSIVSRLRLRRAPQILPWDDGHTSPGGDLSPERLDKRRSNPNIISAGGGDLEMVTTTTTTTTTTSSSSSHHRRTLSPSTSSSLSPSGSRPSSPIPTRYMRDPDLVDLPHLKSTSRVAVPVTAMSRAESSDDEDFDLETELTQEEMRSVRRP